MNNQEWEEFEEEYGKKDIQDQYCLTVVAPLLLNYGLRNKESYSNGIASLFNDAYHNEGDPKAQFILGWMYHNGVGFRPDFNKVLFPPPKLLCISEV